MLELTVVQSLISILTVMCTAKVVTIFWTLERFACLPVI